MHLHVTAEINHWRVNSGNLHDYRNCGITEVIRLKKLRHYKNYGVSDVTGFQKLQG